MNLDLSIKQVLVKFLKTKQDKNISFSIWSYLISALLSDFEAKTTGLLTLVEAYFLAQIVMRQSQVQLIYFGQSRSGEYLVF